MRDVNNLTAWSKHIVARIERAYKARIESNIDYYSYYTMSRAEMVRVCDLTKSSLFFAQDMKVASTLMEEAGYPMLQKADGGFVFLDMSTVYASCELTALDLPPSDEPDDSEDDLIDVEPQPKRKTRSGR